jgi:hypothetical protein
MYSLSQSLRIYAKRAGEIFPKKPSGKKCPFFGDFSFFATFLKKNHSFFEPSFNAV